MIKVFRRTVTNAPDEFTMPSLTRRGKRKNFYVKNREGLGGNSLRITFEGSGTDYITLDPGEQTPTLGGLRGGEKILTDGVGGDVVTEFVIWED